MIYFGISCFKVTEYYRPSNSWRYIKTFILFLLTLVSMSLALTPLLYSANLPSKYKQTKCAIALFFDELLGGQNIDMTDGLYYWDGYNNINKKLSNSIQYIIGNSSSFIIDNTIIDATKVSDNDVMMKSMKPLFQPFLSASPDIPYPQIATTGALNIPSDLKKNASTLADDLEKERALFYQPFYDQWKKVDDAFKNIAKEPTTHYLETNVQNNFVNVLNNYVQDMIKLRDEIYVNLDSQSTQITIYCVIASIIWGVGTVAFLFIMIGYTLTEWIELEFFYKFVKIGFFMCLPFLIFALAFAIPSMMYTYFFADVCNILKKDVITDPNRVTFINNPSTKSMLKSFFSGETDLYKKYLDAYMGDFKTINNEGMFISGQLAIFQLSTMQYPITMALYNNLTTIWGGEYEDAFITFDPNPLPLKAASDFTKACKVSGTLTQNQPDQVAYTRPNCENTYLNWPSVDIAIYSVEVDIGIRCVVVQDYFDASKSQFPAGYITYTAGNPPSYGSSIIVLNNRYHDGSSPSTCTTDFFKDVMTPLNTFMLEMDKQFNIPTASQALDTCVCTPITLPATASATVNEGLFVFTYFCCLRSNTKMFKFFGEAVRNTISKYIDIFSVFLVELPTMMDIKMHSDGYDRLYSLVCKQLNPIFYVNALMIYILLAFSIYVLFITATLVRAKTYLDSNPNTKIE